MTTLERVHALENRVAAVETNLKSIIGILNKNQESLESVANDTAEIREMWIEARAAFRFFNHVIGFLKAFIKFVVLPVALICAALYAWAHDGKAPGWVHSLMSFLD